MPWNVLSGFQPMMRKGNNAVFWGLRVALPSFSIIHF
jgi:hypothetical protein